MTGEVGDEVFSIDHPHQECTCPDRVGIDLRCEGVFVQRKCEY